MTLELKRLVTHGEIEFLGKIPSKCVGKQVSVWREIKLKHSGAPRPVVVEAGPDLPGWRATFPCAFKDPNFRGILRVHKGEL